MRLAERRILITGAASGIGRAVSELFSSEGASLALADIDAADITLSEMDGPGEHCAFECDVRDEASVNSAVPQANAWLGGLDGVVNCAGVSLRKPLEGTTLEEWNQVLSVNLTGTFLVCRAAAPFLKAVDSNSDATIVNIGSGAAFKPSFDFSAYCASKGGVVMFTKAIAFDLAPFGVRVNAVCPGVIDTPMIERAISRSPDPTAAANRFKSCRMSRMGQPREIAEVALFLSSNASSYVSGSAIAADGGSAFH